MANSVNAKLSNEWITLGMGCSFKIDLHQNIIPFLIFLVQQNISYFYVKVPAQGKKKKKKANSVKIQGDNKIL